jgi:hypothetical protein
MEARRTFQSEVKSSRIWIVVAALLAAIALGLGGAYAAKGLTSSSAPASAPVVGHVVQSGFQGPDAQERNLILRSRVAPYAPSHKHQTVF